MPTERVVVVGAGIAGLVAALLLSYRGVAVTVIERSAKPGGKVRQIEIAGKAIDVGPTVFTMRSVFEAIFAAVGASLSNHVTLRRTEILARHAWSAEERLDLFPNIDQSADAIGNFAGAAEARGYRDFCKRAQRIFESLDQTFIHAQRPSLHSLVRSFGLRRIGDLWQISPFDSLWNTLGDYFRDPRLRQMFARYATYCGSSPFLTPATLMLVAHVEREGVWLVEGGMHQLARALATLAARAGATLRYRSEVREVIVEAGRVTGVALVSGERIGADAVLINADTLAVSGGQFGAAIAAAAVPIPRSARSLSAITWAMIAPTTGFPLVRHNVFFSGNYENEFERLQSGKLPVEPTVYVCAQDRSDIVADQARAVASASSEALLCLVNAPPCGDVEPFEPAEIDQCKERTFAQLKRCGLRIEGRPEHTLTTTPSEFDQLYPATGGALYGPASHGWVTSFRRPGSRTGIPGLYLAGGSTHPGPGVPMAAISGRLAADAMLKDFASTQRFPPADMSGGMSMH